MRQLDTWRRSQSEKLSTLEAKLMSGHKVENSDTEIAEGLDGIISEVALPMMYILQIRLRYGLGSAILIVPKAIETFNTNLERVVELTDAHPRIENTFSQVIMDSDVKADLIERVSKRYLATFEGSVSYSDTRS